MAPPPCGAPVEAGKPGEVHAKDTVAVQGGRGQGPGFVYELNLCGGGLVPIHAGAVVSWSLGHSSLKQQGWREKEIACACVE